MAERPKGDDMRNARFKAWDTKEKKWFEPVYMAYMGEVSELVINQNGAVALRTTKGFYGTHPDDDSGQPLNERFIICWYAGRKDKNGKEIFDDDIVEAPHDFGPGGFSVRRFRVLFHNELGYQWQYWLMDESVVIGNFHQTPELLEK